MPFLSLFWGRGSPTKRDVQKEVGTHIPTSLLVDLAAQAPALLFNHRSFLITDRCFPRILGGLLERSGSLERMGMEATPRISVRAGRDPAGEEWCSGLGAHAFPSRARRPRTCERPTFMITALNDQH